MFRMNGNGSTRDERPPRPPLLVSAAAACFPPTLNWGRPIPPILNRPPYPFILNRPPYPFILNIVEG